MYQALALAFSYPREGLIEELKAALARLPQSPAKKAFARFVGEVEGLPLPQWEERYTATLDMNPKLVPYIGYVVWGESYRRGDFMAALKREMDRLGVDTGGELPDHLVPVLRYLDRTEAPLPELVEVFEPAVARLKKDLAVFDPKSPYRHLLEALLLTAPKKERRKA